MNSIYKLFLSRHVVRGRLLGMLALLALVAAPIADTYAGELVPRQRRLMMGGNRGMARQVRVSTFSAKRLNSMRSSDRPSSLSQNNPYEARIVANERAQQKYEVQLARYQNRIENKEIREETKARRKIEKQNEKEYRDYKRERDKLKREAQRQARDRQRASNLSAKSVFGSLRSSGNDTAAAAAPTAASEAPRRNTLWQRLKTWLFGSSSDNGGKM